jgi:hypothetical protein
VIELNGSLHVTVDDQVIEVVADGKAIRAEVSRPRRVIRSLGSPATGRVLLRALALRLFASGMTLTVTRNGAPLLRVGAGIRPTLSGRLLRIPHLEIFPKPPHS